MDRRTLLAISLCFLIFMGWQKFYIEPRMPAPRTQGAPAVTSASSATGASSAAPVTAAAPVTSAPPRAEVSVAVSSGTGEAQLSSGPKFLSGWNLRNYRVGISHEAPPISLASVTNQEGEIEFAFDDASLGYLASVTGTLTKTATGALWAYEDANIRLTREFSTNDRQPFVDAKITAEFKTKKPSFAFLSLTSSGLEKDPEAQDRQLLYWSNQSLERVPLTDSPTLKEVQAPIKYIAATNRYFLISLISQGGLEPKGLIQPLAQNSGRLSMVYPISGNSITIPVRIYFGPKELGLLRATDPALDNTVDFGWFTVFAYPILKLLNFLYGVFRNYGIAIIVLTLILKLVTYPLTYKSMKSMKEMAKLQPQLQKIKEKHKDDKEALNREMLTLMKSHGYNPMAGCLPMLIQMPVFFALYRVLYSSIELYHAPFGFWIHDLSLPDPFYVTPILLTLTMFLQQKMTPSTATDPAQQKMMQFMPLMFGAFMLALPSGLTIYMLVNSLAGIAQQMILNKKLDTGHVGAVPARAR